MLKRMFFSFFAFALMLSFTIPINAQEKQEVNAVPLSDEIIIIDEVTLENTTTNEGYIFTDKDARDHFLAEISMREISTYVCLPGDAGYPTCTGTYIVSSELQTLSSPVTTGNLDSKNYLCGNAGWVWGPGTISYSATSGVAAQYSYNGAFSLSFSHSVTTGASFQVPSGKKGNIIYRANFRLTHQRYKYKLSDGSITYGASFYSKILIEGGFALYTTVA